MVNCIIINISQTKLFCFTETISQLQDLPPISPQQLKHLGKARPKKPKTRAPTRPSVRPPTDLIEEESSDRHVGIETFFRPGSATPIVTPDSDEWYG